MITPDFVERPLFGVALTVIVYALCTLLARRYSWVNPLVFSGVIIIGFLNLANIPYESYKKGGDYLMFLIGPATVALGVPIYKNAFKIFRLMLPLFIGLVVGSVIGLLSTGVIVFLTGGDSNLLFSSLPKSVTTPIALEITGKLGGLPELTALFTTFTGILGGTIGPLFLRKIGVHNDIAIGTAMGAVSHAIGTARVLRDSELQGSVAAISMGLTGIITPVLVIPLYLYFS